MKALLLTATGLRPSYLGCYGSDWVETPNLDRLAAHGSVFDDHYADDPDPIATRRAWRTGLYQLPTPADAPAPDSIPDLLALLRKQKVATALVTDRGGEPFAKGWSRIWHRR